MAANWIHWFCTDWHWALVLLALMLLCVFGVVIVGVDDNGDWWIL